MSDLPSASSSYGTPIRKIEAEDVHIAFVHGRSDVIELCNECVLQPIDELLGNKNSENWLSQNSIREQGQRRKQV